MRACLLVLLVSCTASASEPIYVVTNKTGNPPTIYKVENKTQPQREYWQGYGWVEKRGEAWHKVEGTPGVVQSRPFQQYPITGPGTIVQTVVDPSTLYRGGTGTGPIITLAPVAGRRGGTNCST